MVFDVESLVSSPGPTVSIAGLALSTFLGLRAGYIPQRRAARVWLLQGLLVAGIAAAYRIASNFARR